MSSERKKMVAMVAADFMFGNEEDESDDDNISFAQDLTYVLLAGCLAEHHSKQVIPKKHRLKKVRPKKQHVRKFSASRRPLKKVLDTIILDGYSENEFQEHFRLTKQTYKVIFPMLKKSNVVPSHHQGGREKLGTEKYLLIALCYYASQSSYQMIAEQFHARKSTVMLVVRRISDWLCSLATVFIRWPEGDRVTKVERGFFDKGAMPDIIGSIGFTGIVHVPTKLQKDDDVNQTSAHSIILQAVATADMLFTDLYIGEPGPVSNATVLEHSPLFLHAESNPEGMFPNKTCLVGDASLSEGNFPTFPWLVTPFPITGHLSSHQVAFNWSHALMQSVVMRAFNRLKGRFHRLWRVMLADVDQVPKLVMACCVLHNICELNKDSLAETVETGCKVDNELNQDNSRTAGGDKRTELMKQMFGF